MDYDNKPQFHSVRYTTCANISADMAVTFTYLSKNVIIGAYIEAGGSGYVA
jgi:hypothetical protein